MARIPVNKTYYDPFQGMSLVTFCNRLKEVREAQLVRKRAEVEGLRAQWRQKVADEYGWNATLIEIWDNYEKPR